MSQAPWKKRSLLTVAPPQLGLRALCQHSFIHGQVSAGTGLLGPAQPQVHAAVGVLVGTQGVVSVMKWPPGDMRWGGWLSNQIRDSKGSKELPLTHPDYYDEMV